MRELSGIGAVTAFAGGMVSFLSPCVLPLVPSYVSYVAGRSQSGGAATAPGRLAALGASACFVLGFSTVFVALGASATALGRLLLAYRYEANLVGGAIVILFGLVMTGVIRLPWLERDVRLHLDLPGGRAAAAYLLGLAFAFGWTPCIGPVLGAILTISASNVTVGNGVALLTLYSLGLGMPFLATALFADAVGGRLRRLHRLGRILQIGAGAVVALMGAAMITGQLTSFSTWLLETFPVLARIG